MDNMEFVEVELVEKESSNCNNGCQRANGSATGG